MALDLELVDDSDMNPDAAKAFRFYLASAGRDGGRSLLATSNAVGVSINTVRSWSTKYRWPARAKEIDRATDEESYQDALRRAALARPRIVSRLLAIMDDEEVRVTDQLTAIGKLMEITGLAKVAPPVVVNVGDQSAAGYEPAALAQLSPDELLALLRGSDPAAPAPALPAGEG